MGKKILVLNGSPRKNGNTAALIDNFVRGAQESGNTVTRVDLQSIKYSPCIGCLKGGKDPESPCVQKDDMDKVYPAYKDADVIILASPLYYWSFSAQLKGAIDRLFAVTEEMGKTPIKDCMLIIAAEDASKENFAPMTAYYEALTGNLGWSDKGQLLVGNVFQTGDIEGKPELEAAYKLGASIK